MESDRECVCRLDGPSELIPLVASFADLSCGTEFQSYKEPQWRFLLSGREITGYVVRSSTGGEEGNDNDHVDSPCLDGCVLKVRLEDDTVGFGMVLVRPSKRGRGLARLLLEKAMQMEDNNKRGDRYVLAVCSSLGQPLYRKLGFHDAGVVTALSCSASDLVKMPRRQFVDEDLVTLDGESCTEDQLASLVDHDARATGVRREGRIRLLLRGYADGSRSTVAFLSTAGHTSTGVVRQDCVDGPLIVGPMSGKEECCIPLMHVLIEKHLGHERRAEPKDVSVVIMIKDHPNLVRGLMKVKGMIKLWECPAMSLDGSPIYRNGNGSYLAMMHPTLG